MAQHTKLMQMYLFCVKFFPKFSAMEQAEWRRVNATYGSNIWAILGNFNWDADTRAKLQSAYKEAGKNYRCFIERQQVIKACDITVAARSSGLACTLVNEARKTPTIMVYQTYAGHVLQKNNIWFVIAIHNMGDITFACNSRSIQSDK